MVRRTLSTRLAALLATALVIPAGASLAAPAAAPGVGSPGIGDPYYPTYGNGGYDVRHYGIDVVYRPGTDKLIGHTRIRGTAAQPLRRFDLDLALRASAVKVNGAPARFTQTPHELVVTPRTPLTQGQALNVDVRYAGLPAKQKVNGSSPWIRTGDGAAALGEPEIAAWWFPSNDHPRDKATFDVRVTVPRGVEALGNGALVSRTWHRSHQTWHWRMAEPMATYLAFFVAGQFDITRGRSSGGIPVLNAVAANGGREAARAKADLARTPEIIDWEARQWGDYPFDQMGGVAPAADFGFALENQTRPVYSRLFWSGGRNVYVVVHELAHQWYGDSVSVKNWRDIWLNEGFASFTEWLWSEKHGQTSAADLLDLYYRSYPGSDSFWKLKIGNPGKGNEFDGAVYDRGAMTLQALRNRIGDPAFFEVMRTWAADHAGGNGSIPQFTALAERVSGQELTRFFRVWLYTARKPGRTAANGLPPARSARATVDLSSWKKLQQARSLLLGAEHAGH